MYDSMILAMKQFLSERKIFIIGQYTIQSKSIISLFGSFHMLTEREAGFPTYTVQPFLEIWIKIKTLIIT